ncbi:MAG: sugar transporter permease [Chloroflexi bacterium]|nr:sugar transporter permease [Chloroflexota bacterium]
MNRQRAVAFYISISPWLIGFLFLTIGPMLLSLYASFTDWDLLTAPVWNGGNNYIQMLDDPSFHQALKVTALYTLVYVPFDLIGGLLLAMLVQAKLRGISVFRTIIYLPTVFSGVAFVVVWIWMLNPRGGLINLLLAAVGIQGPRWLQDPSLALWSLVLMSFWGWGRSMVIFLAGLLTIPSVLYEAAAIDGAGSWKRFWKITLPLLTPTIFFNLVLSIIMTFQTFTSAFIATDGGPLDSTLFLVLYIYREAFQFFNMGYASALAWVLFIIIMILTLLLFRSQRFWVFYLGEERE